MPTADDLVVEVVDTVTDDDVAALAALLPQLSSSAAPLTRADLDAITGSPATMLFVARSAGSLVGSLTLAVFAIPTGTRAWIEDVVVDETQRGRGVGSALVRAALVAAGEMGAKTVDLTSRPSRQDANRLYQRLGFEARQTNVYRYELP